MSLYCKDTQKHVLYIPEGKIYSINMLTYVSSFSCIPNEELINNLYFVTNYRLTEIVEMFYISPFINVDSHWLDSISKIFPEEIELHEI